MQQYLADFIGLVHAPVTLLCFDNITEGSQLPSGKGLDCHDRILDCLNNFEGGFVQRHATCCSILP